MNWLEVVSHHGVALQWVPENERTLEIYLADVQHDWKNLKKVPNNIIDFDVCLVANPNLV